MIDLKAIIQNLPRARPPENLAAMRFDMRFFQWEEDLSW
jgi:hypothetical protein